MTAPPHNLDVEQALLGACMLSGVAAARYVAEDGIRPEHFYRPRHASVFAAIIELLDAGEQLDHLTVTERLRQIGTLEDAGGADAVAALTASPPDIANLRRYGRDLLALARWRERQAAAHQILAAVDGFDDDAYLAAERALTADIARAVRGEHMNAEQAASALLDAIQGTPEPRIPVPLPSLGKRMQGGLRGGQLTAVIGPGHHGKSTLADQIAQCAAENGYRVGIYINEMSVPERVERFAARMSNVALDFIAGAAAGTQPLSDSQARNVMRAMNTLSGLPLEFINASGWTGRDVIRHANRLGLRLLVFDILQRLPFKHQSRRFDMDEALGEFDQFAKRTGCHVLYTSHINRERTKASGEVPTPVMSDVSESKMIVDLPDNVIAFWREQHELTKDPTDDGAIKLLKARSGKVGGFKVSFYGDRQTIADERHLEAA